MADDDMGLGVHGTLRIVTHQPAVARAGGHSARIRIGQGYLTVGSVGQRLIDRLEASEFLFKTPVSLRQMRNLFGPHPTFVLSVNAHHLGDVAFDIRLHMREAAGDLALGEVLIPIIDGLELATVNGHALAFQRADAAAQLHELRTGFADGGAVIASEICNRLMIRHQAPEQPHHLDIAPDLALQPAAGRNPVEIAIYE